MAGGTCTLLQIESETAAGAGRVLMTQEKSQFDDSPGAAPLSGASSGTTSGRRQEFAPGDSASSTSFSGTASPSVSASSAASPADSLINKELRRLNRALRALS